MGRKPTVDTESVAEDMLRAFVERILRMREEALAIKDDIREIYAEAKGNGFDKTVLGQIVAYLEKRAKDADTLAERSALFDLYLAAVDGDRPHAGARTREIIEQFGAESGDDQSTAPRTDVGDNTNEVSAAPHTLDPVTGTTPPVGTQARPVDTQSQPDGTTAPDLPAVSGTTSLPAEGDADRPLNSADPAPGVAAAQADEAEPQSVTVSSAPIAFTPKPRRPLCRRLGTSELCGGYGPRHCGLDGLTCSATVGGALIVEPGGEAIKHHGAVH